MLLTNSYGSLRHGPAWFTTSPQELAKTPEPKRKQEIVVRRKNDGTLVRIKAK
jgi:hypothetical protein